MQYIYQFQLDALHSKVGGTGSAWDSRYKQAKTWTVVDPAVVGVWMVDDWKSAEKAVHSLLNPMKLPHRREVFNSSPEIVFGIIKSVLGEPIISGDFLVEKKNFPSLIEIQSSMRSCAQTNPYFCWLDMVDPKEASCSVTSQHHGAYPGFLVSFGEHGFDFLYYSQHAMYLKNRYDAVRTRFSGVYLPVLSDDVAGLKNSLEKSWKQYVGSYKGKGFARSFNYTVIVYADYVGAVSIKELQSMLYNRHKVYCVSVDEWKESSAFEFCGYSWNE